MSKLLITGTGRCGTGYMAQLFNKLMVEASHEKVYSLDSINYWNGFKIECSWLAMRYFNKWDNNIIIYHLHRHPLEVINSFASIKFFKDDDYWPVTKKWIPSYIKKQKDLINMACRWYLFFNYQLLGYCDWDHRIAIENISTEIGTHKIKKMLDEIGIYRSLEDIGSKIKSTPKNINSRKKNYNNEDILERLTKDNYNELSHISSILGYELCPD